MLARFAENTGIGCAAGMVGSCLECLNGWARRVRAVQEQRRLGCALSAWLEAIRPDQVRPCCVALRLRRLLQSVASASRLVCFDGIVSVFTIFGAVYVMALSQCQRHVSMRPEIVF